MINKQTNTTKPAKAGTWTEVGTDGGIPVLMKKFSSNLSARSLEQLAFIYKEGQAYVDKLLDSNSNERKAFILNGDSVEQAMDILNELKTANDSKTSSSSTSIDDENGKIKSNKWKVNWRSLLYSSIGSNTRQIVAALDSILAGKSNEEEVALQLIEWIEQICSKCIA